MLQAFASLQPLIEDSELVALINGKSDVAIIARGLVALACKECCLLLEITHFV